MIAFRLPGGVPVYTFAVLLGFSAAIGLAWIVWQALDDQEARIRVDAGIWVLLGGLLGGRVIEVVDHWAYYQARPLETLLVPTGGFSMIGAVAGGLIALLLFARLARKSPGVLADALLPLMTAVTVGVWLGYWVDGYAYGPLAGGWWGLPARDEWGGLALRIPVQLIGALSVLGTYGLIDRLQSLYPGEKAVLGILGGCVSVFALSFLRADPERLWGSLRPEAWVALAAAGCCLLALWMTRKSTG